MILVERISSDPDILDGKPVVLGTHLAVGFLIELLGELLGAGESEESLLANYAVLKHEDIRACYSYANRVVRDFGG